jgi:hypothetical protein
MLCRYTSKIKSNICFNGAILNPQLKSSEQEIMIKWRTFHIKKIALAQLVRESRITGDKIIFKSFFKLHFGGRIGLTNRARVDFFYIKNTPFHYIFIVFRLQLRILVKFACLLKNSFLIFLKRFLKNSTPPCHPLMTHHQNTLRLHFNRLFS